MTLTVSDPQERHLSRGIVQRDALRRRSTLRGQHQNHACRLHHRRHHPLVALAPNVVVRDSMHKWKVGSKPVFVRVANLVDALVMFGMMLSGAK